MIKKTTLKFLPFPDRFHVDLKKTNMIGNPISKTLLFKFLNYPDVPYLLIKLNSLIRIVLPQQLFKAIPGSLLKKWFYNWYLKAIADFMEIYNIINEKMIYYKNAYYNWMENFMEMEYDTHVVKCIPAFTARRLTKQAAIKEYSTRHAGTMSEIALNSKKSFVVSFEKVLIGINKIFGPKPDFYNPALEIINAIDDDHTKKNDRCEIPKLNNSKRISKLFCSFNRFTTSVLKYVIRTIGLIKPEALYMEPPKVIVVRPGGHLRFKSGFS